jgi:hypothetical protein
MVRSGVRGETSQYAKETPGDSFVRAPSLDLRCRPGKPTSCLMLSK